MGMSAPLFPVKKCQLVRVDGRALFRGCAKKLPAQVRDLLRKPCNGGILFLNGSRQGCNCCIQLADHVLQFCKLDIFCFLRHFASPWVFADWYNRENSVQGSFIFCKKLLFVPALDRMPYF